MNSIAQTKDENLFLRKIETGRYAEIAKEYKKFAPTDTVGKNMIYRAFWAKGKNRNREAIAFLKEGLLQHWTIYSGDFIYLSNHLLHLYIEEQLYEEAWQFYTLIKDSYYPLQAAHFGDSAYSAKIQTYCTEVEKFLHKQTKLPALKMEVKQKPRSLKLKKKDFIRTDILINQRKFEAIWDTGSPYPIAIPWEYAIKNGIACSKDTMIYMDSIQVGDILFRNVPTYFASLGNLEEMITSLKLSPRKAKKARKIYESMGPIIGLPLLKRMRYWEIDWGKRCISFDKKEKTIAAYEAPMFLSPERLCTTLILNDTSCLGMIDTGNNEFALIKSTFYENAGDRFLFRTESFKKSTYTFTFYGIKPRAKVYLENPRLVWGNREIPQYDRIQQTDIQKNILDWDLLLGYSFFKSLGKKVTFDFEEMKVRVLK